MSLEVSVTARRGAFLLAVEMQARAGEVVAVVGPNGAGKSTLLAILAGLVAPDTGRVVLDGTVLDDAAAGIRVPTERRSIGVVFQDYLLFPHLNALDNVAFGLTASGMGRAEARRMAGTWLERMGVAARADALPHRLSGGEAQRVALARALAVQPRMLLLDEPLSSLDAATRPALRAELRHVLRDFDGIRILITHDPLDATALSDRIVVVEGGTVVQAGRTQDVAARPRSRYVADLVGVNLLLGHAADHGVTVAGGAVITVAEEAAGDVFVVFHPRTVVLHLGKPEGSPRNVWQATIADLDDHGDRVRVRLGGPIPAVAEVTPAAVSDLGLGPGVSVWCSLKATEVAVYPA